jgi:hypothetical protein
MPGIRLIDVRAALAALGLAGLAALAVAIATHLPAPALSGPPTHAATAGLSKLQALPLQAQSVISTTLGTGSHGFAAQHTADGWRLGGGGVRADFAAGEPTLTAGGGTLSLSLAGVPGPTSVTAHGNRVTLARPGISEWYAAGPLGVEQGFTLAHRPAGATAHGLTLALAVGGSLRPHAAGSNVSFVGSRGDIAARYGGLTAVDAAGRRLPGTLSVADGRVRITVNDRGARYPITIDPLVQQSGKLVPNDLTLGSGNQVGGSVALSADGNTALVGGKIDNSSHGSAWVFIRSGSTWTQQGPKLVPNDGSNAPNSQFGASVALSADGNTALIGGDLDSSTGAAWVFTRNGGTWTQQGPKILGDGGSVNFGTSVALSPDGTTALIGDPGDNGGEGAVWPFIKSASTFVHQGPKLVPNDATSTAHVGSSVALSSNGSTAFTGGPNDNTGTGAAWAFTRAPNGTWSQQGSKLVANDEANPLSSQFGSAVALSSDGTTALIGGPDDNNTSVGGAAWIFSRSGSTWSQLGSKILPTSGVQGPNAQFGSSVALSSDASIALIGAFNDATMVGSAYLFTRSGSGVAQQQRLTGTGETGFGQFGSAAALAADGQTAMIGADVDNNQTGAVFVFAPPNPVCNSVAATGPQGGGSIAVSLSCTLPFGAHPNFSILGGPSNGTLSGFNTSTGQLTYSSAAFFSGQDSFTYRVSDQWGISNIATATLTLPFLPVPTCSNVTARGKAGATKVTVTLKCKGPKGHSFRYGIVSKPGNGKLGKIKQSNGKVTYTTHVGAQGNDRFVYNATDAGGSSKAATATIKLPKLKRITSGMNWDFNPTTATFTQINSLSILALPGGAKATLTCTGKGKSGCPISKHTVSVPKHRVCKGKGKKRKCKLQAPKTALVNLSRFVSGKHLSVGTKMTVTMFEPGWIGKRFSFTIIKNHQPPDTITAMAPGSNTRLCPQC